MKRYHEYFSTGGKSSLTKGILLLMPLNASYPEVSNTFYSANSKILYLELFQKSSHCPAFVLTVGLAFIFFISQLEVSYFA